ncbi:MarR family winged helix-turn-helix transcriptional regulator [Kitasatospora sp. NPDC006697]|uniref:MarR family winged helix-turn-helix transcriptional regulator n=1 Tax=Kitasatospora sp. NPDC006697 TaxID=3364020 RepID=UPI0036A25C49
MDETTGRISASAGRAARDLQVLISRVKRRGREMSADRGLTPSQLSVLVRLGKEGPASAGALAAGESIRPQSMAAILAVLGERGLIERHPDPADGRRQLVTLSAPGRAAFEGARQEWQEWLARAFQERYTEQERETVNAALALLERLTATEQQQ